MVIKDILIYAYIDLTFVLIRKHMSTLMSCVRKEKLDKFKELLPDAKPEHVNQSLIISIRDQHMTFFPFLIKHEAITLKTIHNAFECATFPGQGNRDALKVLLKDKRITRDYIMDRLLA